MNGLPLRPPAASEHAIRYDWLLGVMTVISLVFVVAVGLMVVVFATRYHQSNKVDRSNPPTHNRLLEALWIGVPLVLSIIIFWWSSKNFLIVRTPPADAMELFVIGKQWMWHVQHPNGIRENNEMTVPVNQPIKLTMVSQDVIHSMYLPAFRAQYHVVPGRYTDLWFTPIKVGTYRMLCAMHCGSSHSEMVGYVNVLSQADYAAWLESGGDRMEPVEQSMVQAGYELYQAKRCFNCHEAENTDRAPQLAGIFGQERQIEGGGVVLVDLAYIRHSIVDPERHIVAGYDNTMPNYSEQLTEEDVLNLAEYLKTLGTAAKPEISTAGPAAGPNTTDVANEEGSAGASQAEGLGY